jgi:hypothetical protein
MRRCLEVFIVSAAFSAGCGGGDDSASPYSTGGTEGGPGDDGMGGDGDEDGDPGIRFDTPDGNTGGGDEGDEGGCKKVDFLFVVDNSGSMWDNQINLANSFPGFIATIQNTLDAQDYHILVTDSDPWTPDSDFSNGDTACEVYPYCCYEFCGPNSVCEGFDGDKTYGSCPKPPPPPTQCDATLGAGRNLNFDLQPCPIEGGERWMTDTQPDLEGAFECAARAGIGGSWHEEPVNAAVAALQDPINGADGCNEGFLRNDAILVMTVISDANPWSGHLDMAVPVQQWHDAIIEAKGGNEDAVVVIGMFPDGDLPGGHCTKGNEHYKQFVDTFGDQGFFGSVCAPDYIQTFLQAVATIDSTCEDFVPEG